MKMILHQLGIRDMIKNNDKNITKYLPKPVYKYIIKNKLYKL